MKACIFFFFRNFSFSSFRIFRSMVLREKRKNCWSFRKRKQLKFIFRPRIPAVLITGGRQLLKASWRYCCSLLFRRISGQAAQALERVLATRLCRKIKAPWPFPGPLLRISLPLLLHLYAYPIDFTFCCSQASSFKIEHGGHTERTLVERLILSRKLIHLHFGLVLFSQKHVDDGTILIFLACLNIWKTTIFMTLLFKLNFSVVKAHRKKAFQPLTRATVWNEVNLMKF